MNDNRFEQIEDYIRDMMSPEEKLLFESELKNNGELRSLFNIYKTIETEMVHDRNDLEEEASLKRSLQKLRPAYFSQESKGKILPGQPNSQHQTKTISISSRQWLAVAAAATVLIVMSASLYLQFRSDRIKVAENTIGTDSLLINNNSDTFSLHKNDEREHIVITEKEIQKQKENKMPYNLSKAEADKLYQYNFKPDVLPDNTEGPLEDAFAFYENKDYHNAIIAIDNPSPYERTRGEVIDSMLIVFYSYYYKGLSHLAEGQSDQAISDLKSALSMESDNKYQLKAQWYLALGYLQNGDILKSKRMLEKVASNNQETSYKLKANTLLKELKSPN